MHVGTQQFNTSDEDLEYLARHGVFNKNENFITFHREYGWDVAELKQKKEKCARFGIDMEMVAIPIARLNASGGEIPNYMLGNREEGDREIELVCNMLRQAAEAGIPAVKYYLCAMENQRTASTPPGRGNSVYSTWDLEQAQDRGPRFEKPVTAEMNWERITCFLERVIPVAEECRVRMACHPCDPWLPPGYRGVDRVLGGPEGFKRFIEIVPSDYCGVNLCLGCMAEASTDPCNEVPGDHPLLRQPQQDLPLPLPQHRRRPQQVPGGLARRGGDEHAPQHAGPQRGGVPAHVRARPRPGTQGAGRRPPGVRLRVRLHQGDDTGGYGRVEALGSCRRGQATNSGSGTLVSSCE